MTEEIEMDMKAYLSLTEEINELKNKINIINHKLGELIQDYDSRNYRNKEFIKKLELYNKNKGKINAS